jgi:1,4-dihydroxy-2-naphthoate polyprenyltransferase
MATAGQWWGGARVRTLPAAIAPVAVGTGLAEETLPWEISSPENWTQTPA